MIKEFKTWCLNKGFKAHRYEVLHNFVEGVKQGEIQKCAVCGEYNSEEHMTRARFDYNEVVCPDCERDGN